MKKKLLFIVIAGVFVTIEGSTNNTFPKDTVIHKPSYVTKKGGWNSYNQFDTLNVLLYEYDSKILINGISLDSCFNDKNRGIPILYANNRIYFQKSNIDSIAVYSPNANTYDKLPVAVYSVKKDEYFKPSRQVDLSKTQLYRINNDPELLLYKVDSKTGKETLIANFTPFTNFEKYGNKYDGTIEQVCAIGKSSYIVKSGIWDQWSGDSYVDVKYFQVNNSKIQDLTNTVSQWIK
jgi:hypothetical protein